MHLALRARAAADPREHPHPISIPVPVEYEPAELDAAPMDYSYWMLPSDVPHASETGHLPGANGYMYGKLSMNVAYDAASDVFVGIENPGLLMRIMNVLLGISHERLRAGDHQVVLMKAGFPKRVYALYVATNISTNVVYVAYRPPRSSRAAGEYLCGALRRSLAMAH